MSKLLSLALTLTVICHCHASAQQKKQYTLRDTSRAVAFFDSAGIYHHNNDYRGAQRNYQASLDIYRYLYGDVHEKFAKVCKSLS
jgi:hypothetical protein